MFAPGYFGAMDAPAYFAPGGVAYSATAGGFFSAAYFPGGYFSPGYYANTAAVVPGREIVLPTDQAALLYAVRQMLLDGGVGTDVTIAVTLTVEPSTTVTGTQYFLAPEGFVSIGDDFDGTGRRYTTMEGSFTVDVVGRSQVDQGNRDLKRLTAQSGNLLLDAHKVVECLQEQFVVDPAGNHLSTEPMMVLEHGKPRRYGSGQGHAGVELAFSVGYRARMS